MSVSVTETLWQIVNGEEGAGGKGNLQKYATVTYFLQRSSPKLHYQLRTNLVTQEPVGNI